MAELRGTGEVVGKVVEQGYERDEVMTLMIAGHETTANALSWLWFLLDRHPDLKLVCPHLGGALPYLCGRMDHQVRVLKRGPQHLRKKPSDYLRDIFMDIVSPLPEALRFALDFTSADKLLFASDHPWVDAAEILGTLEQVGLPAETKAQILGGNARRLFKL